MHADWSKFDGNSPFLFDGITIQSPRSSTHGNGMSNLEQTIGEGGFAVINMSNNRKIANVRHDPHFTLSSRRYRAFLWIDPALFASYRFSQ